MAASESLDPRALAGVLRELKDLQANPAEGIRVAVSDDCLSEVHAEIDGPAGTPYDGGRFKMKLVLGDEFPRAPPKGYFITRIFHPNISKTGEICVNTLKRDWNPSLGLRHTFLVIRCLLIEPFPESALNEEAGKLLMEDYAAYARHARLMTEIHAHDLAAAAQPLTANAANIASAPQAASGGVSKTVSGDAAKKGAAMLQRKKSLKRL